MTDGSLLLSLDGTSHNTYCKEEVDKYRIVIDGKTCVFEKENDPTTLRSPSPGKLMQYFVEEGCHVDANQAYVEIESMKMIHNLHTSESGMYVLCACLCVVVFNLHTSESGMVCTVCMFVCSSVQLTHI